MSKDSDRRKQVRAIQSHDDDSVAVVLEDVVSGQIVLLTRPSGTGEMTAREDIPRFHKIALSDFDDGAVLKRHAISIGRATTSIRAGDLVHTHNLVSLNS